MPYWLVETVRNPVEQFDWIAVPWVHEGSREADVRTRNVRRRVYPGRLSIR